MDKIKHLKYRPEIDGLRAIAVLAVIMFHAEMPLLAGGFVGVDIFYVISGYLITKIIIGQLTTQSFDFKQFYARRIKRLFPAAFFLVLVTLLIGSFMLSPGQYTELSKSSFFSSLFLANVWFSNRSGYFDQATEISPLVHMWSLAVEEQFYLIFPVIVYFVHELWRIKGVKVFIISLFLLSLGLSISFSASHPNSSFYLLHTRAWELCLGAIMVLYPIFKSNKRQLNSAFSAAGILLLVGSTILVSTAVPYPSYWALLPTLATVLIINASHNQGNLANLILSQKPLVFIGKISYSAYLWHWPMIVYYRIYISERHFTLLESISLTLLSLILGYLSWRFIEEKFRHTKAANGKVLKLGLASTALIIAVSFSVYLTNGYSMRFADEVLAYTSKDPMTKTKCLEKIRISDQLDEKFCVVGNKWDDSKYKGVIWGDSHSQHWSQAFQLIGERLDIAFVIAPKQCPPYLNANYVKEFYPKYPDFTERCSNKQQITIDWLNNSPEVRFIVMSSAWSSHIRKLYNDQHTDNYLNTSPITDRDSSIGKNLSAQALAKTIESLDLTDRKLLLLSDIPRPNRSLNDNYFSATTLVLRANKSDNYSFLDETTTKQWHLDSDLVLSDIAQKHTNVRAIILTDKLCDAGSCPSFINSELIYRDDNHLRSNLQRETVEQLTKKSGLFEYFTLALSK